MKIIFWNLYFCQRINAVGDYPTNRSLDAA